MVIMKLTNDYVFKKIFSNPEAASAFLSDLLKRPESDFESLTIENPIMPGDAMDLKTSILDLKLKLKSGEIINIEMQVVRDKFMVPRLLCQSSKIITSQIPAGKSGFDKLKKTVIVAVLVENHFNDSDAYHKCYRLHDKKNDSLLTDLVEFHMLELNRLPEIEDSESIFKWCQLFRYSREENSDGLESLAREVPKVAKVVEKLKEMSQSKSDRMIYEDRERALMLIESNYRAEKEAGREEGRQEGRIEEKLEVARKMKLAQFSDDQIIEFTGLGEEDLLNL